MEMEQEAKSMGEEVAACTHNLKEKFSQGADAAKKYANQAKDAAKEYASKAKDVTEGQIKENPFWSMLIALGVGMTLGALCVAAFSSSKKEFEY
jgi:ElaB/YqjD/DUF883 family membrane-anchored ribosome-binding protein